MTSILKRNLDRDFGLMLSWRYAEVEFLGLPKLTDERAFRLEHIYVPLRLYHDYRVPRFDEFTFHVPKALQTKRHLIVLGDPGSGKSTLIKVLTYAFGEADSNAYKRVCGELIPIPIILREHQTHQWRSYEDLLRDFIATLDSDIRNEITSEWLLSHLENGKAILLIDGLDEVGSRDERSRLRSDIIFPLLRKANSCPIVLTSRIVGYDEVSFDVVPFSSSGRPDDFKETGWLFSRCYVAPFDDQQIAQFITRWYQLRETSPKRQREGVESLSQALSQNDRVKGLAHNPQLLTLIALIHRVTANLPSGRVELYDKIVEAYLETIQTYRKLGTPARLDEMKRWLAKVGWKMQVRRDERPDQNRISTDDRLSVSRENIREWLVEAIAIERGPVNSDELADHFLDYVAKRSGLLVPNGPESFSFSHLTFQEYFAAFELRGEVRSFNALAEKCAHLATRFYWHETLNLLFEMLAEFPGAGDDLFDEVASRTNGNTESRNQVAGLFAALLLDEQSGLHTVKQREAIEFTLTAISEQQNRSVLKDLQSLPSDRSAELIRPWFLEKLRRIHDSSPPEYFFLNGDQLLDDWPQQLTEWIIRPNYCDLTGLQMAEIALTGARDEETYYKMCPWMIEHLPLSLWFKRVSRSFGDGGGITLSELYRPALLSKSGKAPQTLLLAEMSMSLAITKSQILRLALALVARALPYQRSPHDRHRERKRYLSATYNDLNDVLRTVVTRALIRAPIRDVARDLAHNLAVDSSSPVERKLASAWREAVDFEMVLTTSEQGIRLAALGIAERALFLPDEGIKKIERLKADLDGILSEPDHWSQLVASSALLVLGYGTPELCRKRNVLLAEGMNHSAEFTFPEEFHSDTQNESFRKQLPDLLDLLFQQSPTRRWLKPDLFDCNREFSTYFLSKPREFFELAMEVLDRQNARRAN